MLTLAEPKSAWHERLPAAPTCHSQAGIARLANRRQNAVRHVCKPNRHEVQLELQYRQYKHQAVQPKRSRSSGHHSGASSTSQLRA